MPIHSQIISLVRRLRASRPEIQAPYTLSKICGRGRCFIGLFFISLPIFSSAQKEAPDFFEWNAIPEIHLSFYDADWHERLDSMKQSGSEQRLLASLTYDEVTYDSVGVRYKGNSSFHATTRDEERKLPFNIKLDEVLDHTLPGGYDKIKLSNVFRDPTFLREVISYEVARRYMPAPRANFAKLYINGEYLGLYNNTESIDKSFLRSGIGDRGKGVLFKCDPTWGAKQPERCPEGDKASLMYLGRDPNCYFSLYEKKSDRGWTALVELTRVLHTERERIEDLLNVELTLWMLAFNTIMVNLDSYSGRLCHNYYLYQDTAGIFHPLVWDMNLSLGGFRYDGGGKALSNEELTELSPFLHFNNPKRPLISVLLKNPNYRKRYVACLRTLAEDHLINGQIASRIEELHEFIAPEVAKDPNRLYPLEDFEKNISETTEAGGAYIIGLMELLEGRSAYLAAHPLFQKAPPSASNPAATIDGEQVTFLLNSDPSAQVKLYIRRGAPERYIPHSMRDDGKKGDQTAGDGIFTLTLPYQSGLEYYFTAENEDAMTLIPRHAGWFGLKLE